MCANELIRVSFCVGPFIAVYFIFLSTDSYPKNGVFFFTYVSMFLEINVKKGEKCYYKCSGKSESVAGSGSGSP
jgi:hypothetical protein